MFVVTLPRSAASSPAAFAKKAKKAGANVLEIRSDLTSRVKKFSSPIPLLVAVRGKDRGLIERLKPAFIDFDAPSPLPAGRQARHPLPRREGRKLILSFHDYKGTPSLSKLKGIVVRLLKQKPWAIKIATTINEYDDLVVLEQLHSSIKHPRLTILGMGDKAHLSRLLSPVRNHLTYACLDDAEPSAPGQLPMSLYALTRHLKHPKLFGIIGGSQVTKSLSPVIHNALFASKKIDAAYSCFPTDDFKGTMKVLQTLGITGLSVTAPFKKHAFDFAKTKDPMSTQLGVVNTLLFARTPLIPNPFSHGEKGLPISKAEATSPLPSGEGLGVRGKWIGFNTDWIGVCDGYPFLKDARNIAIIGAGGAVPSVIAGIRALNPDAEVTIFIRHPEKAADFEDARIRVRALTEAKNSVSDVLICAVTDDVVLPMPKPADASAVAIDLRYGMTTAFMKHAAKNGFRVYDGVPMLMHQALQQFELFTQ